MFVLLCYAIEIYIFASVALPFFQYFLFFREFMLFRDHSNNFPLPNDSWRRKWRWSGCAEIIAEG